MGQRLLNVRIRPARVCVLISRGAIQLDLLLAFEFLSKLWGGRFGNLLAVNAQSCDDQIRAQLEVSRPDFVYGIGIDDVHWATAVNQVCQPRGYVPLRGEVVHGLKQAHPERHYLVDHALIHLREHYKGRKQTLRLVTPAPSSPFSAYCAATFGISYPNIREGLFDAETCLVGTTTIAFLEIATEFVKEWQQSWLDVTGHELNPLTTNTGPLSPTIVLVGSEVSDLALFWNLRTISDTAHPAWIIPIPAENANDPAVLARLMEWLLAFLPYGARPNYCTVTSQTVEEDDCRRFAERFQATLVDSPIEFVDFKPPSNNLPAVIPYEYEAVWPVDISARKLTINPPRPRVFENVGSARPYFVDLVGEVKTRRAVEGLRLPPGLVVFEILNGPCPPSFAHTAIPRTGDGVDCINLFCKGKTEVLNIYLPTSEEILEEILREKGAEPLQDEKRSSYVPVIKRFRGIYSAASAFSGMSGAVLTALEKEPKTVRELKSSCQLGDGTLPGKTYMERNEFLFSSESERMKRIASRRFKKHAASQTPENLRLISFLEFWADRSVLTRQWQIGPCPHCKGTFFETRLHIQQQIRCPACGNRISLRESVPLAYSLNRTIGMAIREGIIPVVLTGRFLQNMTSSGFFWLPGVKYQLGSQQGDIDVLACCDGYLVFCECKRLEQTQATAAGCWDKVVTQFLATAAIAKKCKGSLAVLSSMAETYPESVRHRIETELDSTLPYLLLDKQDLEKGWRDKQAGTFTTHLALNDLLRKPITGEPLSQPNKPRKIIFGFGEFTA